MRLQFRSRSGLASRISVAILIAIIAVAGTASYLAFAQGTSGNFASPSTGPSTSASTTSSTTSAFTYPTTSNTSPSTTSSLSTTSSSHQSSASTTSCISAQTTSSSRNLSQAVVIIPPGIENLANKVSFEPINITIGSGSTTRSYSSTTTTRSTFWSRRRGPRTGSPSSSTAFPGQSNSVTFTTAGKYTYFCEWHPIWMDGTINVVA